MAYNTKLNLLIQNYVQDSRSWIFLNLVQKVISKFQDIFNFHFIYFYVHTFVFVFETLFSE